MEKVCRDFGHRLEPETKSEAERGIRNGYNDVAIADDNERTLQLLDTIVSSDRDLKVVGKAGNGEDLIDIIRTKEPDVVLLDIIMRRWTV